MANHHALWRTNKNIFNGDISPKIHDKSKLSPLSRYGHSARFILSTCDFKFLENNFENLLDTRKVIQEYILL